MSHISAKPGTPAGRNRVITLHLRIPTLFGGLLALVVGLIWVFILGILVGRGQAPEEQIPQLAGLMPKVEPAAIAPPQIAEPQPTNTVIPEEELSYTQALKPGTAPVRSSPATPPTPTGQEAQKPTSPAKPEPQKPAVVEAPKETFDYVYQVAAYKSADPCNGLVEKLKKSGLKATVEKSENKGVTWHKAVVSLRGGPEEVKALEKTLASHKLSAPMLRSKKPVTR